MEDRIREVQKILEECTLCPRKCKVNRLAGEKGDCKVGALPIVSSFHPHFGEERPLVGRNGSGTIFFTYCNLGCVFCQNYEISHLGRGEEIGIADLADMMVALQRIGCHNINFVTPTHVVPFILAALPLAIGKGLLVPLVYNSGGYDSVETLQLLEGIFDIYMPDFKYADQEIALKYSRAKDYPQVAKAALKEMYRQVGDLILDERGIAERGLLVRHLVLPEREAGTEEVMRYIAEEISLNTYVNIMDQYRPCYKASQFPALSRYLTRTEFEEAVQIARNYGLHRLDGFPLL